MPDGMIILTAVLATVADVALETWLLVTKKVVPRGERLVARAKKKGWVAEGRLVKARYLPRDYDRPGDQDAYRAKYCYEVDGRKHTMHHTFRESSPAAIAVYYRGDRLGKRPIRERSFGPVVVLLSVSPFVVFPLTVWLLSR